MRVSKKPKELMIAIAQLNFSVGDVCKNSKKIHNAYNEASKEGADLIIFPELSVCGYPTQDLTVHESFIKRCVQALAELQDITNGKKTAMIVGSMYKNNNKIYNSAIFIKNGHITETVCKHVLPTYGIFDETRLFDHALPSQPIEFEGYKIGIMICEDVWHSTVPTLYKKHNAELFIVINASPYESSKQLQRLQIITSHSAAHQIPTIYVNQVGSNDGIVFDGTSFIVNHDGKLVGCIPSFEEKISYSTWTKSYGIAFCTECDINILQDEMSNDYQAMMLGLSEYVNKNNFDGVLLGLSGGIDSALTLSVAVDALGPSKVFVVMLPSEYTSNKSTKLAEEIISITKVEHTTINITESVNSLKTAIGTIRKGTTKENLQARIRGNILMALSNEKNYMLLCTSNKSESAVGFTTLYGDTCGGLAIIQDLYKTQVIALAKWRNMTVPHNTKYPHYGIIPNDIISRPPTAELKPNQLDTDILPTYPILDTILNRIIEKDIGIAEIVATEGFDYDLVKKIAQMVKNSEFKRKQSPPCIKLSTKELSRDRRYPITNKSNV